MGKPAYKSWTISDEFWERIESYIPKHERNENKEYKRKPGGGRKPPDKRKILADILNVLRTGCQWKSIPSGSNVHRYFQLWELAGLFEAICAAGLYEYDELKGLDWEWQSLDGRMTKAPIAEESVGKNPTDRGKNGE
jgi:transposase